MIAARRGVRFHALSNPHGAGACLLASTLALWAGPGGWMGAGRCRPRSARGRAQDRRDGGRETALDRYVKTRSGVPLLRRRDAAGRRAHGLPPGDGVATLADDHRGRQTEWRHWLTIIKPDVVAHPTALLLVAGGDSKRKAPDKTDAGLLDIAMTTGRWWRAADGAEPALFRQRRRPRAFGGRDHRLHVGQFLRTGDERWPARLPMTKAVVRAMDA
jgi:hypothetical protein